MATSFEPVNGQLKAQFADFELDLSSGELIREGSRFRLQGQPFMGLPVWPSCAHIRLVYARSASCNVLRRLRNHHKQSARPVQEALACLRLER